MNKVKMIINKEEMTVKFECAGDVWKWLGKVKNRNSDTAAQIVEYIRYNEVKDFYYETQLNKFAKRFSDKVDEVVIAA